MKNEKRSLLEEITINLSKKTQDNTTFRLIGREQELTSLIEILSCKVKNSCLIVGDPGVGKNALVEGLAQRILYGNVPDVLINREVLMLSVISLLAGTKYRGEFEDRMIKFIEELKTSKCLLFIDDFHHIVKSAVSKGSNTDMQSVLKPAVENGEIQIIGAASFDDYRLMVEKDPAIERLFQRIELDELDIPHTIDILNTVKTKFEIHHIVIYTKQAVELAARLPKIHIRDRALPDKAIEIIDRAGAKARVKNVNSLEILRVHEDDIAEVVSDMSGVPKSKILSLKVERFLQMEEALRRRIVGQDEAISAVSQVVRSRKLGFELQPERPDGIFLFIGPTGVGKTEMSRAMAEFLFGDENKIIRLDMSEYMENIAGAKLIGTAPGYVGYHDQNQLVDRVRRNPYSLILLDEVEKANPSVLSIFLQVFDAGHLTSGKGRKVYFNNTTIVMTSNIGSELFKKVPIGYAGTTEADKFDRRAVSHSELLGNVKQFFAPEFLNRLDEIVFFNPLTKHDMHEILEINLKYIRRRLNKDKKILVLSTAAKNFLALQGYSFEYGARNLKRVLRRLLLDRLAHISMSKEWAKGDIVFVDAGKEDLVIRVGDRCAFKRISGVEQGIEEALKYKEGQ